LIALLFVVIGGIIADFNTGYGENVTTQFSNTYSQDVGNVNSTFGNLQEQMEKLADTSSHWFIIEAAFAIPSIIINTMIAVVKTPIYLIRIISQSALDLNIPSPVINTVLPIVIVMIIGAVIFMLVKFWKGSNV